MEMENISLGLLIFIVIILMVLLTTLRNGLLLVLSINLKVIVIHNYHHILEELIKVVQIKVLQEN